MPDPCAEKAPCCSKDPEAEAGAPLPLPTAAPGDEGLLNDGQLGVPIPAGLVPLPQPPNPYCPRAHLKPDILECEVKWALVCITKNKASGGDRIPVESWHLVPSLHGK